MWGNTNSARLRRVMPIRSFEQAQARYENIKPIRGRSDETIRPLTDRSAVDTYNIRKKVGTKVRYECWMYRTPVITYYENNVIVFDMGGWPSASTRTFIEEVAGFTCGCKDGSSYISLPIGNVVMPKTGPTAIQLIDGKWELVGSIAVHEIQLQRKEANAVRKHYKPFTDYLNSMIKLRGEHMAMYGAHIMQIELTEFKEEIGGVPEWSWRGESGTVDAVFRLIAIGDTESHYKAFLLLVALVHNVRGFSQFTSKFNIRTETLTDKFKELMYRKHSDEVFKRVELPIGKVPNRKYEKWV